MDNKSLKYEINHTRDRIKSNEQRRYQILILSVSGFIGIFGLSGAIDSIILKIIMLVTWIFLTSTLYYNQDKNLRFLNSYLIELLKNNKNYTHCLEDAYFECFYDNDNKKAIFKRITDFRYKLYNPFIIFSLISVLLSCYLLWYKELNHLTIQSFRIIIKLLFNVLIISVYILIIKRHLKAHKLLTAYDAKCKDYLSNKN